MNKKTLFTQLNTWLFRLWFLAFGLKRQFDEIPVFTRQVLALLVFAIHQLKLWVYLFAFLSFFVLFIFILVVLKRVLILPLKGP